ncbi:MAG: T9SS type A sorting domain-containing protein [Crocinitomicaceae bacterium]|nr:T9SS type A sorting domain-containing protein [Crocinitomicaceae bacterium]
MVHFIKTSLILIITLPLWTHAQWDIVDQKVLGGNRDASNAKYLKSNDGGYYFGFSSNFQTSGNITAENQGPRFGVLRKYDDNDDLLWEKSFGGNLSDNLIDFKEVSDGIILLFHSTSTISGMKDVQSYGDSHGWLVKVDLQGEIILQKSFGGNVVSIPMGIEIDDQDDFYFGFRSNSPPSGTRTAPLKGSFDFWVVKTDAQGNILWDKSYGSDGSDGLVQLGKLSDGTILLAGRSTGNISIDKSESSISSFGFDLWVVAINQDGDLLWDRTLGGEGAHTLPCILTVENEIYIASSSNSDISGNRTVPLKGNADIWLIKLSNEGNILYQKSYGGEANDGISSMISLNENRILLMGGSNSDASLDKSEDSRGGWDYWPIVIDKNGNLIIDKTIGGNQDEYIDGGMFFNDKLYLAGNTLSGISGDKTLQFFPKDLNDIFNRDIWIVQLDASTLGITEQEKNTFSIYPNPVSEILTIDFLESQNVSHIQVFSIDGKQVAAEIISEGDQSHSMDVSAFPKGVYSVLVFSESGFQTKKVVK